MDIDIIEQLTDSQVMNLYNESIEDNKLSWACFCVYGYCNGSSISLYWGNSKLQQGGRFSDFNDMCQRTCGGSLSVYSDYLPIYSAVDAYGCRPSVWE